MTGELYLSKPCWRPQVPQDPVTKTGVGGFAAAPFTTRAFRRIHSRAARLHLFLRFARLQSLTLPKASFRQVSRNSLKDRKRSSLSAQDFLALSPYSAPVLSVPRGYPSDSRNATLPEKVPPAGQSVLCFEKGSRRMKHVERNQQHLQGGYAYWKEAPHETDRFLADCSCSMLFLRPTRAVRSSAASCVYLRRCIFIADPSVSES